MSFYDHLVNLLINEFKKLVDLMIFQIACIPQTEERNFPGRKLNFSKLSLKYSLYVAPPIKIMNKNEYGA